MQLGGLKVFSEVLNIIPRLDSSSLANMERTLSSRFAKVAKGFGKGIAGALTAGGLLGIATSVVDKLLNPLKETQEAITRTLEGANNVVTEAKQFGSTPGELFKLQALGKAKGLEPGTLGVLLTKFQGALAEAKADPTKDTSVRLFANDKNIVESFFQFIQNLNKMPQDQQVRVQNEVFGERQTLKMAEFLQSDFSSLQRQIGAKSASTYDKPLTKLSDLNDVAQAKRAGADLNDISVKGRVINQGMIDSRAAADALDLKRENERIANFQNLQSLSNTAEKINGLVEKGVFMIGEFISNVTPKINAIVDKLETFSKAPWIKGLGSLFGGGKGDK